MPLTEESLLGIISSVIGLDRELSDSKSKVGTKQPLGLISSRNIPRFSQLWLKSGEMDQE